jgi:predicted metal-dependent hydrolase
VTTVLIHRPPRQVALPDGRTVAVLVRESPRARTTRIRVGAERPLEIIVPRGTEDGAIDAALGQKRAWIADKLERVSAAQTAPFALDLQRPGVFWRQARPLELRADADAPAGARIIGDTVIVGGPPSDHIQAIGRLYRREAGRLAVATAHTEAERLGIAHGGIAVRDQRTRWGSCAPSGTLSFNWRLILAPAEVLRYITVHELCHVRVPNHSRAFWRLVDAAMPDWREPSDWLRRHEAELRAYDAGRALRVF